MQDVILKSSSLGVVVLLSISGYIMADTDAEIVRHYFKMSHKAGEGALIIRDVEGDDTISNRTTEYVKQVETFYGR